MSENTFLNEKQCEFWADTLSGWGFINESCILLNSAVEKSMSDETSCSRKLLQKAVICAVTTGNTSALSETILLQTNYLLEDLLEENSVPIKHKKQVTEFLFVSSRIPKSGYLDNPSYILDDFYLERLLTQGLLTPTACFSILKQLIQNPVKSDLLSMYLKEGHFDDASLCRILVHAVKSRKPETVRMILKKIPQAKKRILDFPHEELELFALECGPAMRRTMLCFTLTEAKLPDHKKSSIVKTFLKLGEMDTSIELNFSSIFKFSMSLLLSDTSLVKQIFDKGFQLDSQSKEKAIELVLGGSADRKNTLTERVEVICILLENQASADGLNKLRTHKESTPLHVATQLALKTGNIEIVKKMIMQNHNNRYTKMSKRCSFTPLHVLTMHKECNAITIELCKILCHEAKINPSVKDDKQKTAIDYATEKGHSQLVEILCPTIKQVVKKQSKVKKQPNIESQIETELKSKNSKEGIISFQGTTAQIFTSCCEDVNPPESWDVNTLDPPESLKDLLDYVFSQNDSVLLRKVQKTSDNVNRVTEIESIKAASRETVPHEDITFEGCKYDVYFSQRVKDFIQSQQSERNLIYRTLQKVHQIACGDEENQASLARKLKGHGSIYHCNIDDAKRILWHKVRSYSHSRKQHCKVLVILDIVLDHDKISKCADEAQKWIKQGVLESGTYKVKRTIKGVPSYYEIVSENTSNTKNIAYMMKDDCGAIPIYSLPEYVLKSILMCNIERFGLPMKLSHEEHAVIDMNIEERKVADMSYHEKTILVVGRSGTGKTTCCLMRLWEEFLYYWQILNKEMDPVIPRLTYVTRNQELCIVLADQDNSPTSLDETSSDSNSNNDPENSPEAENLNELDHLHQVFVTKNPFLCQEVKRRFYDLLSTNTSLRAHQAFESKPLPTSLQNVDDLHFPLFVTSRDLLILLDGTLGGRSFFKRKEDGSIADKICNTEFIFDDIDTSIFHEIDEDEEEEEVEDDIDNEYNADENAHLNTEVGITCKEVTASYFTRSIWPKIAKGDDRSKLDPILVWQEINSFIKGSVNSLHSEKGYLSLDEYKKVGNNKAPNFADSRTEIYKLFEKYQQFCNSPGDKDTRYFDECDLLFHLSQRMKNTELQFVIHNFYIDEVQDFTEAELYLLLSCSQCPNGNFLCGDSAQSIMKGVAFRFVDVRSLFHELNEVFCKNYNVKVETPEKPNYLTINYRANAGILRVSDSVIELLARFFKDSFDVIRDEKYQLKYLNITHKPMLILYNEDEPDQLPYVLAGNQLGQKREIEFGAHQAIIVASEEAKKKIPSCLEGAIILTVLEAKGLEFNDVLLFDFFSESKVRDKISWELVSAYYSCEQCCLCEPTPKHEKLLKEFDQSHHKTFNSELKYLYTAVTRAKRNLWICDKISSSDHPIYRYWLDNGFMKQLNLKPDSEEVFASGGSTSEEWSKVGNYLMAKRLWDQAEKCYAKANDRTHLFQVHAYKAVLNKRYKEAAVLFLKSHYLESERVILLKAAQCLKASKLYYEAAKLFEKLQKVKPASECYLLAKDFESFIKTCELKKWYNRVVSQLSFHGEKLLALKKAVQYVDQSKLKLFNINKLAHECIKKYTSDKNLHAVKEAIMHLESPVLKIKYLDLNGFHKEVLDMHTERQNFTDAFHQVFKCGFYKQGLEIAESLGDHFRKPLLQLCDIYQQLPSNNDIMQKLQYLQNSTRDEMILGQAFLLQGKLYHDKTACTKALEIFKELKFEGGVLETANILLMLEDNGLYPEDVVSFLLRSVRLSNIFKTPSHDRSPSDSNQCSLYIKMNQMQKHLDGNIIIPPNQAYWLSTSASRTTGIALKTEKEVYELCCQHFLTMSKQWLTSTNAIEKLLTQYRLHKQVLEKWLIPKSAENYFTNYLSALSDVVELHKELQCYPLSQDILLGLFSPLSILHNHAWRRSHLISLQTLTAINSVVKGEFAVLLHRQQRQQFVSLDECFKLWHLSILSNNNSVLYESLSRISSNVPNNFIAAKHHIFLSWMKFCHSVATRGVVSYPLHCVYSELIIPIANSRQVRSSISDENLLYIMIIETVSSLYLASLGWKKAFFVPNILRRCVGNFDLLNVQSKDKYSVVRACVHESQQYFYDLSTFGRYSINRLQKLLNFLLGLLNSNCNVLSQVLENGNDTLGMYFIVLILTISANLYIARPRLENKPVYDCLVLFVTHLQSIQHNRYFIKNVYENLLKVQFVGDLFVIVQRLLDTVKNTEILQIMPNEDGSYLLSHLLMDTNYTHYSPIPIQPILPNQELEKQLRQEFSAQLNEEVEDLEGNESFESSLPVTQDDVGIIDKLKENMIENNVCKICNLQISTSHFAAIQVGDAELDQPSGLERQKSIESDYDKHIASQSHIIKKSHYENFVKEKKCFDAVKNKLFKLISKMKRSSTLSPEDDIKLTEYEHGIQEIIASTDYLLANDNDWLSVAIKINKKTTELENILSNLKQGTAENESRETSTAESEALLSPDIDDILPGNTFEQKHKKRKQ